MARTLSQIYQSIIDEKNTKASLVGLLPSVDSLTLLLQDLASSPSAVAVWRLWCFIMAACMWVHEGLWDVFKADVETIIANKEPGTLKWYQNIGFLFQYGDPLIWVTDASGENGKYVYAVIDPAKQIVNRCATIERSGSVVIKAAIEAGGVISSLTAPQLVALNAYYQKMKYAGPPLVCESNNPDTLKIYYTVYYDALADLTELKPAVEDAINNYLAVISGVSNPDLFNGRLTLSKLTDAIQKVTNVTDPRLTDAQGTYGGNPYTAITGEYNSNAGYCIIDPAFPLSTTITYEPYA
jgi:hypothetical protein